MPDVARVQPAAGVERRRGRFRVVQVSCHHLRATDQQLSIFARAQVGAARGVDDAALGVRHQRADRPGSRRAGPVGDGVRHRTRFGEPVALDQRAPEAPDAGRLERGVERSGAGHHRPHAGQVVAVDRRVLGQGEDERRHHERPRDAIRLQQPEERL